MLIMPRLDEDYVLIPDKGAAKQLPELPDGVVRVGRAALAATRLAGGLREGAAGADDAGGARAAGAAGVGGAGGVAGARAADAADARAAGEPDALGARVAGEPGAARAAGAQRVQIAAFDFDGTSLSGNSPVMLVRYLARLGMLSKSVIARIILWGGAYKARLPQNESWVRGLVFSAFRGKPVCQVNKFLRDFYAERVSPRVRAQAVATMQDHLDAGHVVVCVSATFEPIIAAAMLEHPIQYAIATRMKVDAYGCYTDEVEGLPVEGSEKIAALTAFADERFGKGGWELGWAYGDHHSDRTLLAAARHGFAVTPDRPLARTAREQGYDVLEWSDCCGARG